MNKLEIENRLRELKIQQSDYFKKKKADRDPATLETIRSEKSELKAKVRELYSSSKKSETAQEAE